MQNNRLDLHKDVRRTLIIFFRFVGDNTVIPPNLYLYLDMYFLQVEKFRQDTEVTKLRIYTYKKIVSIKLNPNIINL